MKYILGEFAEDEFAELSDHVQHQDAIKTSFEIDYDSDDLGQYFLYALENADESFYEKSIHFYSILDENEKIVGAVFLSFRSPNAKICQVELWISYKLSFGEQQDVVQSLLKIFKEEIKMIKVFVSTSSKNTKAVKLLEYSNFIKEGHLRKAVWDKGEIYDELIYGKDL